MTQEFSEKKSENLKTPFLNRDNLLVDLEIYWKDGIHLPLSGILQISVTNGSKALKWRYTVPGCAWLRVTYCSALPKKSGAPPDS